MSLVKINHQLKNCFSVRCIQFSSIIFNIKPKYKYCTVSGVSKHSDAAGTNHLLEIKKLPEYNRITGETVESAIPILVEKVEKDFKDYEENLKENRINYTWENAVTLPDSILRTFELAWGAVSHLHSVRNNLALREAYGKVQPSVVSMATKISQSRPVFDAVKHLELQSNGFESAQKRIIATLIKGARNSGVHLEGDDKEKFNDITQKLAKLGITFSNNVLDSTKAFSHIIYDKKDTAGLPDSLLSSMASAAGSTLNMTADASSGPWKLSLDIPCFMPFMMYSKNRELREMVYLAYISRASNGETDNTENIESIRQLRRDKSSLLGFESYSDFSLDKKMAKTPSAVWDMINDLKKKVRLVAQNEYSILQAFANDHGHVGELKHWDSAYWSEKQKEKLFNFKEEELRDYFPVEKVLNGLFMLCNNLFGIKITEVEKGTVETWNSDVRYFVITDSNNSNVIASFFLDLYARPNEKNGGAWFNSALGRNDALGWTPVAYLICNQRSPVGDSPSLMTINEVQTLFHEFGHGLQHMLTEVKYPAAAGINNVEWDAVELPSQFMENWLYDWNTIKQISSHYVTGEHLPIELFKQINKAKNYQAGMANLRQLYFSALDMELHTSQDDWKTVMNRISDEFTVLKPHIEDRFPCSFLHIFAGGYSAGYYSYKWAEVLSADAFSSFEDIGLDNREELAKLGRKFRNTILAKGGSVHPEDNFVDFRGRKPDVDALLKSYGIN